MFQFHIEFELFKYLSLGLDHPGRFRVFYSWMEPHPKFKKELLLVICFPVRADEGHFYRLIIGTIEFQICKDIFRRCPSGNGCASGIYNIMTRYLVKYGTRMASTWDWIGGPWRGFFFVLDAQYQISSSLFSTLKDFFFMSFDVIASWLFRESIFILRRVCLSTPHVLKKLLRSFNYVALNSLLK